MINHHTLRNYAFIPKGSTVAIHLGDGALWICGNIIGKGDHNHNNRSYMIHITKTA